MFGFQAKSGRNLSGNPAFQKPRLIPLILVCLMISSFWVIPAEAGNSIRYKIPRIRFSIGKKTTRRVTTTKTVPNTDSESASTQDNPMAQFGKAIQEMSKSPLAQQGFKAAQQMTQQAIKQSIQQGMQAQQSGAFNTNPAPNSGYQVQQRVQAVPVMQQGYPVVQQGIPVVQQGYPVMQQTPPMVRPGYPVVQQPVPMVQQGYPVVQQRPVMVQPGYNQGRPPMPQIYQGVAHQMQPTNYMVSPMPQQMAPQRMQPMQQPIMVPVPNTY